MLLSVKPKTAHQLFAKKSRAVAVALCIAGACASMATKSLAASNLTIIVDRAKIVKIAGEIGSVIVGNPSFADISVQKKFVIIHGRSFGQTNILILDENGEPLADMEVTVVKGPNRNISVFRAGLKASYACAPNCESTLQVGDSKKYFDEVKSSIETKMTLAQRAGKLTSK